MQKNNSDSSVTETSRILIADDNEPNRELLEVYLADIDCEIATAVDGHDTLEKVTSFDPDIILLDIMMPKLSGFEVCQQLKTNPTTRQIMVLMVTALGELRRHRTRRGGRNRRLSFKASEQNRVSEAGRKHAEVASRE